MGTEMGYIFNRKSQPSDAPQESPEGAWLVTLHHLSDEERKGYISETRWSQFWTRDSSLKISIIEW